MVPGVMYPTFSSRPTTPNTPSSRPATPNQKRVEESEPTNKALSPNLEPPNKLNMRACSEDDPEQKLYTKKQISYNHLESLIKLDQPNYEEIWINVIYLYFLDDETKNFVENHIFPTLYVSNLNGKPVTQALEKLIEKQDEEAPTQISQLKKKLTNILDAFNEWSTQYLTILTQNLIDKCKNQGEHFKKLLNEADAQKNARQRPKSAKKA